MNQQGRKLRAIDLYAGVGGWSVGLQMAGIEVVASYERWEPASRTNALNSRHTSIVADIRKLSVSELPADIDVVVGSPPCTQFSFSNRGGGGDIEDGLTDIAKFFEIVSAIRPLAWAMENVPRVEAIIKKEMMAGGRLAKYRHLKPKFHVVSMDEYGVPQRRKRCIVTNVDVDLLKSYTSKMKRLTLGEVIQGLACDPIVDPLYGREIPQSALIDQYFEPPLDAEEERINRASKQHHPVYNSMAFPDSMSKPVRTVTATCTRVSRESVVIASPQNAGKYRRLTIRERACLQGFPIDFQFYGDNHGQKLKMVGNALPPPFAFCVGGAIQGISAEDLPALREAGQNFLPPSEPPKVTTPERPGRTYRADRRFRFALPSLRLKSGVRFELRNEIEAGNTAWSVHFVFGDSKNIQTLDLNSSILERACNSLPHSVRSAVDEIISAISAEVRAADIGNLQAVWSHKGPGRTRPFMLLDCLDQYGARIANALQSVEEVCQQALAACVASQAWRFTKPVVGFEKLKRNSSTILAGIILGAVANGELDARAPQPASHGKRASKA